MIFSYSCLLITINQERIFCYQLRNQTFPSFLFFCFCSCQSQCKRNWKFGHSCFIWFIRNIFLFGLVCCCLLLYILSSRASKLFFDGKRKEKDCLKNTSWFSFQRFNDMNNSYFHKRQQLVCLRYMDVVEIVLWYNLCILKFLHGICSYSLASTAFMLWLRGIYEWFVFT